MDETYQKIIADALDESLTLTGKRWDIPQDIAEWLGRLLLLYGVPFNYLVPEEAMLPSESIRFFYLDPGWMKCLLEGSCSVGKSSSLDELFDQKLRNKFLDLAGQKATEVRTGRAKEDGTLDWPLTGFLLRSDLVEGWQGVEMQAWSEWNPDWENTKSRTEEQIKLASEEKERKRLKPLRIDRLAPNIILCIFNGKVNHIEIKQPPEGLHFGAEAQSGGNNAYKKYHLRKLHPAAETGDQIEIDGSRPVEDSKDRPPAIDVPMRYGSKRVMNVQAFAEILKEKLQNVNALNGSFTSAEFAVQMVDSPGKAIFNAPKGEPS